MLIENGLKESRWRMNIYMDNAASTCVKKSVIDKFDITAELCGNPSSKHLKGWLANNWIESVKRQLAMQLNCDKDDCYFTMGATMSNQLCIQGFIAKHPNGMVITTNVEHNDIMMLMDNINCFKQILCVDKNGLINLKCLKAVLDYATNEMNVPVLVTIQMANSESGIIQPIIEIGEIISQYSNVFLYMDATQYIPYYPIDMEAMHIDGLGMSGQKIGGIKGSGLFVVRQRFREHIKPIIYGEQGLIGGTFPTPLIASLGEAFKHINYNISSLQHKRDVLLSYLKDIGGILVCEYQNRLPNNIFIRFPGVNGITLMNLLSDRGIYIGTGSACSTDSDKPSHVALAYGLSDKEALECVRFTLCDDNTYEEIEYVVKVLKGILPLLQ